MKQKLDFSNLEQILQNKKLFNYVSNHPLSICDPYYNEPFPPYVDNSGIDWDAEYEKCNAFYADEIKEDSLRYPLILEMEALKKERAENPIIFDKEQEYYETDPHKLMVFDEFFTPFFEEELNEAFFRNIKDPIRLKWEEIPEYDRKQRIVSIEEAIRKIQYDEIEVYFEKYLKSEDLVILFLKYIQDIWTIETFSDSFKAYITDKTPFEIHDFFITQCLLLSSRYTLINKESYAKLKKEEKAAVTYFKIIKELKKQYWNILLSSIKPIEDNKPDILTDFINKYDLLADPEDKNISRYYKYKETAKIVILLNLSFFNLFPIGSNLEFENIRKLNKPIWLKFLWYLKDFYWAFYESSIKIKKDIKSYFEDELEYSKYASLIEYYPIRMVQAKEYFFTHHNLILGEVVLDILAADKKAYEEKVKTEYRLNADFYNLNKELQGFEKVQLKIYAKFRKLNKSEDEIKEAINNAYLKHLKRQKYLDKLLFVKQKKNKIKRQEALQNQANEITNQNDNRNKLTTTNQLKTIEKIDLNVIDFFLDDTKEEIITKTYDEIIAETKKVFIQTLTICGAIFDEKEEAYQFTEPDIYKKIFKLELMEPNLLNKFTDYCFIAIDRYAKRKIKPISEFIEYQQEFINEFMRDIMFFWGEGSRVAKGQRQILYRPSKRRN